MISTAHAMIQRNKVTTTVTTENKERHETREESLRKSADEQRRLRSFLEGVKVGLEADERLKYYERANRHKGINGDLQEKQAKYIIHPKHSIAKLIWDIIISLLLAIIIIFVPFVIGFDLELSAVEIVFDYVATVCFGLDMILNFFVAYLDRATEKYIFDMKKIAINYLKLWFWLDLVATIPWDAIIGTFLNNNNNFKPSV